MVIYVDRVINMPIHYTFNILSGKHRTGHMDTQYTIYIALDIMLKAPLEIFTMGSGHCPFCKLNKYFL